MTQKIIDTGAQPDDGQGDPLRTAFSYTNDNFTEIYDAGPVGSNIRIANNTITTTVINSDLVLSPSGIGKIQVNNNVLPRSDDVYELGSSSQRFNAIYLGTGGLSSNGIITTTGNISAGYFIGDGSLLTGITANAGSKLSNGTSNINIPSLGSNIIVSVSGTANVVTFSNTGAYVIGTVSATGNVSGNYILGNGALLTGLNNNYSNANVATYLPTYTGNLVSLTGPIVTTANITGGNVATGNVRAGNINASGAISATGNVTGRYFIGDGSLLTNLPVSNYSNANVAAYLPTYTGNLVSLTGPVITTANVTGGNLQTSGIISATGNITGGNVATGRVNAGNVTVSGPISATGNITGSYFIGNGSQLTGIVTNYSNANVAAYLPTYTGNLASLTGPVITTANVVGGNVLATGVISTAGNITGGNVATGKVNAGNVIVSGPVSASGNITGSYFIGDGSQLTNLPAGNYSNANVAAYLPTYTGSLSSLTGPVVTTGNIIGGNLRTAGAISSTGNITSGNVDTGRVNAGNVTVSGPVSATGNITGSYFIGNGSQLTGIAANYSNANVAAYLPTYTGSLTSLTGPVITTSSIAGSSLSIGGNVIGGNVDTGRVNAGNVTVSGPVSATGNITGSYFIGDGSLLTNLPAGNYSNANVASYLPTYTGSLPSLTGLVTTTANVTGGNLRTSGTISATGNITGGNVSTGTINSGNILSSGSISAAGNITGSTITSGNILPAANVTYDLGTSTQRWKDLWLSNSTIYLGDAQISANATAITITNPAGGNTVLQGTTGNNTVLSNVVSASGNITGGNVTTTGLLSVTGNITGGNLDVGRINAGNITVSGPLSTTGNVTGTYFIGDGSLLTNLPAGNYSNANVASYLPTYTGSLPSLTGAVITTANVIGGNVKTTGIISATGNITGGNVDTGNVTAGNVSAFGNVIGTYFLGDGSQLTNLPAGNYSNANVANYLPTYTGNLVSLTGPVVTTANITGGNLRTTGAITATGNITGNNVNTNTVVANAVLSAGIISTAGNVVGNNLVGTQVIATTVTATANVVAGNVTTTGLISATGNIRGGNFNAPGGTFTGFTVSVTGTVTGGNLTTLGIVSAFGNITGGNMDTGNIHAGNVISNAIITAIGNIYTDQYFIGNGKFLTGLDTYSNANVAAFLPTYTGNLVSLTGPVITTANIVGANITASGLISAAGTITSAANITGGNIRTAGLITATGNLTAGNLITTGLAAITGNVTGGNIFTAGQVSAAGNITGSNIRASGAISASGSITTDGSLTLGNTGKINFGTTGSNIYLVNLSPTTLLINAEKVDFTGSEVTAASITGGNVNAPNNLNAGNVLANGVISTTGNIFASNLQLSGSFAVASLNTTGNVNAGNLRTTGQLTATGNITGGNILTNGRVSAAGNITGNYFIGNGALLTGIVVSGGTSIDNGDSNVSVGGANSNITVSVSAVSNVAVFSTTGVSVLGNVAGTFLLGNGAFITGVASAGTATSVANGTSNINIPTINGNVIVGVAGIGNAAVFSTRGLSLLGNVSGNYIFGNGAFLTGLPDSYGNANVAAYLPTYVGGMPSMTGLVSTTGNVSAGEYVFGNGVFLTGLPAGYSNANVGNYLPTYSGNLPSLTGLVSTTGNISGNYILGNGALLTGVITSVANINNGTSNINITTSGGNITASVGGTSNVVVWTTTGEYVTGVISASGNVTGGNVLTNGLISAIGNIAGGNILTGGVVSATGNINGGNLLTSGLISSTGNIVASNFVGNLIPPPGGVVSTTGNIFGGNILADGFVSAAGNVTGNYFIGNGSQLTGVTASSVNANALVGNTLSSNVLYSSLTSVGTLGNLSVTGNIDAGNLQTAGLVTATGNVTGGNVLTAGLISATANVTGGNVLTSGLISATANVTGGNVLTAGLVSATGNVTGNYILGNGSQLTGIDATSIQSGNSNVRVVSSGGNVAIGIGGTANIAVFATTGEYVTGELSASGTVTSGNLVTGGTASVTGNITGGNVLTGGLISATATITGGNLVTSGTASATGNITGGNVLTGGLVSATGTVVGGNLLTAGNLSVGGVVLGNLIPAANEVYDLGADGAAWRDLWLSGSTFRLGSQTITSNTTTVAVSNSISTTNIVATGNITAVGGNVSSNNILATGIVSVTGNITGGNIRTAGLITSTGNITSGNMLTAGLVSATGNVTSGNFRTAGLITATGNVDAGNILTSGLVSATGNATANNVTITGGTLAFANANIIQTNALDLAITGAYQISIKPSNGAYQWTFNNDGSLTGPTGVATTGYLSATGNIFGNNIFTSGFASIIGNVITANVNASSIRPVSGELTITTPTGNLNLQPAGNIVLANTYINSVAYPAQDTDAASKLYVDNMVSTALTFHQAVYAATTTTLATTTSGSITYTQPNGVANGVGATLTTTGTFDLIDTANVQTIGTRILVKNEANAAFNGVYTWANATNIVRSTDTDEYGPNSAEQISINDYFFVQNGTINGGSAYVVDAPAGTITFGSSNIAFAQFSQASIYTANTSAGLSLIGSQFNAKVDNDTTAFDAGGNIIVKAGANLTTPNIGAATGTSLSLVGNAISGNVLTGGLISAAGNVTALNFIGNIVGNVTGLLGNNVNMGTNTAGALVSNAVTLTANTTITNGIALLNQILGKLVPPSPPNFPGANTLSLSGIATYRMANITQVDNTPGANRSVAAGTSVANVLRAATYATNTIANVGPGDSGTITAVRNGSNVGNVTLNTGASPSANGTYGGNLIISNNFDYNSANANITAGFWYVFSSRVSGTAAPAGWNELYIADSGTANTNTTVWYYDNSSPSTPSFSSTTMTAPGSANLLYSSTIPHYTNNNNFTIAFNVANISGNTYPGANTLASGSAGGAFAAPTTINYNGSNIGSNILPAFASASANTTVSVTTGFGGSSTGPSMSVNNSYSTGTLTLTAALGNTVLWKSGTSTAIEESNVVINTTIGTGSGNAFRIANPGTGNTPTYTGSAAAFNSQTGPLQTYDATVVGSGSSGVLKHDQTNYASGYLPAGPNLSAGRSGTQYFTIKFVRTAVSKFDIKYTGTIAGMWVALPGSVIDASSSANGWIDMAVAYGGAGYPGVNSPGNGSDGCAVGGVVSLNTSVTNSSKTCTFGTVSSSSTATNEIYVRIALTSGQSVTALTLETASN